MNKTCNNCKFANIWDDGCCYEVQSPYASEICNGGTCQKWRWDLLLKVWNGLKNYIKKILVLQEEIISFNEELRKQYWSNKK